VARPPRALANGSGSVTYQGASQLSVIKNAAFLPSATFTLYAYAFGVEEFSEHLGSPTNGVLQFPSPLNGITVPFGLTICFELDTP
jgi:hypothetical protein